MFDVRLGRSQPRFLFVGHRIPCLNNLAPKPNTRLLCARKNSEAKALQQLEGARTEWHCGDSPLSMTTRYAIKMRSTQKNATLPLRSTSFMVYVRMSAPTSFPWKHKHTHSILFHSACCGLLGGPCHHSITALHILPSKRVSVASAIHQE